MDTLRPPRGKKATAESQSLVLPQGAVFFETPESGVGTGAGNIKIGDGTTSYSSLPYFLKDSTADIANIINGSSQVGKATTASKAGTATYSTNAASATYAATASKSSTATYAINSGTSVYSSSAAKATSATSATYATTASKAGTSTYATNSGTSAYSTNSAKATSATSATYAGTANKASSAAYSDFAGAATTASKAGTATRAINADTATYATNSAKATNATSATYSANAGTSSYSSSAAKLSTARTIILSGYSDGAVDFDGSENITINNWGYGVSKYVTKSTADAPYYRIAYISAATTYQDGSMLIAVDSGYKGGGAGILKVTFRSDNIASANASSCEVSWLSRKGFSADQIFVSGYAPAGDTQYADLYFKANGTYNAVTVTVLSSGSRGTRSRTWTFDEGEPRAAADIRPYSYTTYGTDAATTNYANTAGTATYSLNGAKASSATSATYATTATKAGTATYSTSSGTSTYSVIAGRATSATSATYATTATNAGTASYTPSAGTAVYSTNSAKASSATSATYATTSTNAGTATYATNSGTSTYSTNSAKATSATSATYAVNSGTATYAKSAPTYKGATTAASGTVGFVPAATTATRTAFLRGDGTWQTPSFATSSTYAAGATTASKATSATSATYASTSTKAGTATYSTNSGTATYSTNSAKASSATSATYATTATKAGTATYSSNSAKASSATSATYATTATKAGTATYGTKAGTASYASSAGVASSHSVTDTNVDEASTYYPMFTSGKSSDNEYIMRANDGLKYTTLQGTTASNGYGRLNLGNTTESGTAGNKYGNLRLYSTSTGYGNLRQAATTESLTHYLPNVDGTLLNTANYSSYALPLKGGTLTGQLLSTYSGLNTFTGSGAVNIGITAKNSDGSSVSLMVGSSKTKHGVYSNTLGKWIAYADEENVYLNGLATSATKATSATYASTATKASTATYATNSSTATYATSASTTSYGKTIRIVETEATSSTTYYPSFTNGKTDGTAYTVRANDGLRYMSCNGTTASAGYGYCVLGNGTASGSEGNKYGNLRLYSTSTGHGNLRQSATTSSFTNYLPNSNGTLINTNGGSFTGKITNTYVGAGSFTASHGSSSYACGFDAKRTDLDVTCRVGVSSSGYTGLWGTNASGNLTAIIYRKPTDTSQTVYLNGRIVAASAYGTSAPPTSGTLEAGMVYFQIIN